MDGLRHPLPPLSTLAAFEAAARLLSFTGAGRELHISQAAVSKQIQRLENNLSTALFVRRHRALQLTPAGRELLTVVQNGLSGITACAANLRMRGDAEPVTIGLSVAMAAHCLMPKLGAFQAAHPDIDVRVLAVDRHIDPRGESVDLTISYADKSRAPGEGIVLCEEAMFPVCSPSFAVEHSFESVETLVNHRLLHLDPEHWRDLLEAPIGWSQWFGRFDVHHAPTLQGLLINNYVMLLQAAMDGHGVALGWRPMVDGLLANGLLVRPLSKCWNTGRCHYLITATHHPRAAVRVVRDWLLTRLIT